MRTSWGCFSPWATRASDSAVPPGWLAYSSRSQASWTPRVPRLTAMIGSSSALRAQAMNSLKPTSLVSMLRQARSSRVGRCVDRADAVLPAVARDEVAAGVAHDRRAELADQLEHVGAEAVLVGGGVRRLVDAGVDAAAHVLDERAEQPPVERPDAEGGVDGAARRWASAAVSSPERARCRTGAGHGDGCVCLQALSNDVNSDTPVRIAGVTRSLRDDAVTDGRLDVAGARRVVVRSRPGPAATPERERRRRMSVRMKEVASRAGVSVKTVSNVVNGYLHVAPSTRERVQRAIDEMGYRPNLSARSLRSGAHRHHRRRRAAPGRAVLRRARRGRHRRSPTSAAAPCSSSRPTAGSSASSWPSPGSGPTSSTGSSSARSPSAPSDLLAASADGSTPLVLLGERISDTRHDHVVIDNVAAARLATEHLLSLGRTRVAAIGTMDTVDGADRPPAPHRLPRGRWRAAGLHGAAGHEQEVDGFTARGRGARGGPAARPAGAAGRGLLLQRPARPRCAARPAPARGPRAGGRRRHRRRRHRREPLQHARR